MARPPMSKFFSTISTEAPCSRAAMAEVSPPAPAPDDHDVHLMVPGDSRPPPARFAPASAAVATAPAAALEVRKLRRSIAALGRVFKVVLRPGLLG